MNIQNFGMEKNVSTTSNNLKAFSANNKEEQNDIFFMKKKWGDCSVDPKTKEEYQRAIYIGIYGPYGELAKMKAGKDLSPNTEIGPNLSDMIKF